MSNADYRKIKWRPSILSGDTALPVVWGDSRLRRVELKDGILHLDIEGYNDKGGKKWWFIEGYIDSLQSDILYNLYNDLKNRIGDMIIHTMNDLKFDIK